MSYETVIGLEVHAQLTTESKIFSGAATQFGAEANTQACAIDLGLPGVLPVLNQRVIDLAIRFGLSVNADIHPASIFARKNYFYPDLPKGYQISQFEDPIVGRGYLDIPLHDGTTKRITITRAHLEEDAGKSLHDAIPGASGVDLNRAGTPLLEIVSEPDMRSANEAVSYLKTLHQLVRHLGICDGNMQEGSFRCDINISLRPSGQTQLGTRAEIKNVNSFRFVEQAIRYEIERQTDLLDNGQAVIQETRQYDPNKDLTRSMRSKEEAHDYRYFPDPDLLPVHISEAMINDVKASLPELPWDRRARFAQEFNLNADDAHQLTANLAIADFFETTLSACQHAEAKQVANWTLGEINALLKKHDTDMEAIPVSECDFACLLDRIADNTLSTSAAKRVLAHRWEHTSTIDDIIDELGLKQMNDQDALATIIDEIIASNPSQVAEFRAGKEKLKAFFVGQVMKATKGKANPKQVNDLLITKLQG